MFTRTFTERSRTGNAQVVEVPSVQQVHRKKGTTLHGLSDEVQHIFSSCLHKEFISDSQAKTNAKKKKNQLSKKFK